VTAWKLFTGVVAHVSTADFHAHRERARHLDDPFHQPRLFKASEYVRAAARMHPHPTVSDLGCGDGGLLSLVQDEVEAWGYDFAPANAAGWAERGVKAEQLDVFGADSSRVRFGVITVVTEVLEHLTDPGAALAWIREHSRFLVASSPWIENDLRHDECHAWAFDKAGYRDLIAGAGFRVLRHAEVGGFQVVLAEAAA
jgi:hypothetical protein